MKRQQLVSDSNGLAFLLEYLSKHVPPLELGSDMLQNVMHFI